MKKKINYIYIVVFILILIDQITKGIVVSNKISKMIIQGLLEFNYCENTGVAFGIKLGNIWYFIIMNIIILGIMLKFIQDNRVENKTKMILTLVFAGGLSNLIDRVFRGYVVDFIDINQFIKFPIFNLADIFIFFGIIGYGILAIKYIKTKNEVEKIE